MTIDTETLSQWARELKFNADPNPKAINALGKTVPMGLLAAIALRATVSMLQRIQAAPDQATALEAELANVTAMNEAFNRAIGEDKGINAALAAAESVGSLSTSSDCPSSAKPVAAPTTTPISDQDAFVSWLSTNYPRSFSAEDALRMWLYNHVAALAWRQGKAQRTGTNLTARPLVLSQADIIQMAREAGCSEFRENTIATAAFPWGCEIEIDALMQLANAILERAAQYFELQAPQGSVPEILRAMKGKH